MNNKNDRSLTFKDLIDGGCYSVSLVEELYNRYKENKNSVDGSWISIFEQLDNQTDLTKTKDETPKSLKTEHFLDNRLDNLIDAYRTYGHLFAKTNPLENNENEVLDNSYLNFEKFGFSKSDLTKKFNNRNLLPNEESPLKEIIEALEKIYTSSIGYEYMGIHSQEQEKWIQEKIERYSHFILSTDQKLNLLQQLNKSELFESFIHTKYVGQKRFSLEGAETLIPMLLALIETGLDFGLEELYIGMAHRGRLNVLANIFEKSYAAIFSEFDEGYAPLTFEGSGDVKYHKGFKSTVKTDNGTPIKLVLTPNPSHLESVDPVVLGQVLARQIAIGDTQKEKVVPILIHGDAALSGQGIVYETLQFLNLEGYKTGGTIHFVVNNQIGFTTIPKDSRSTNYCTDIAKVFRCPIFHVNAEDPESCVFATHLSLAIRNKFHCDVFIELVCYRKYGHNETDEPGFTQPKDYKLIKKKLPIRELYRDRLIEQGVADKGVIDNLEQKFKLNLHEALEAQKTGAQISETFVDKGAIIKNESLTKLVKTSLTKEVLKEITFASCSLPEGFTVHPKLAILLKSRLNMLEGLIDWGMGEALAFGSLLLEGINIRLSGQDSSRGTFSHRHAVLIDQETEEEYRPLQHLKLNQARFDVYNSPLSEYSVLGFEFGYSLEAKNSLVIWEAQFGDFANCAQVIIDQYITTSEQKWSQNSALTLFLPHGYEGQGPEHSSARIERFLNLAGDNNIQIVNPTTPAQFFHLIRRQALKVIKKPLIVLTPKGLLRYPPSESSLLEFTEGAFQEIIDDPNPLKKSTKLAFCSGRIYYDLIKEKDRLKRSDVSIIRIEQLYPLDIETLKNIINKYTNLKECIYVQEEPSNMGAWTFLRPILRDLLPKDIDLSYVGRMQSAASAVGFHASHKKEQEMILKTLFA